MVAVMTDCPDPLRDLRQRGIDARLAWHADHDQDALVFVPADRENLARLEGWLEPAPAPRRLSAEP